MCNALKLDENYYFNETKTVKTTPTHFYHSKNTSNYKKTKNTMFVHNFTPKATSQAASREKNYPLFRDFGEKMEAIKEARKNRTLRNLLF